MNSKAIELLNEVLELLKPEELKPSMGQIVSNGLVRMGEAVEAVIAKHENEIDAKATERRKIDEALRQSALEIDMIRGRNSAMSYHEAAFAIQCGLNHQYNTPRYTGGLLGGWS